MEPPPILSYPDKGSRTVEQTPPSSLRRLAAVACRLIALYVASQVVQQAIGMIGLWAVAIDNVSTAVRLGSGSPLSTPAITTVLVAGPVAAAAFLWVRADWLASRMVPDDAPAPSAGSGYDGLLSIGLAVAGAAVLVPAVRDLAGAVAMAQVLGRSYAEYWIRPLASAVAGVALSAWLMFGNRGLVRLIVWARTAGRPVPPLGDQPAE